MENVPLFKCSILVLTILAGGLIAGSAAAGDVNIDHRQYNAPEYLYYIEGTGSYLLPAGDEDIFYNRKKWFRRTGNDWAMSDYLDGPWSGITADSLPRDLAELPRDFRDSRKLGMIPFRMVTGVDGEGDDFPRMYYGGRYYDDHERRGYRRRWNPHGKFWFFVAPDFDDDKWDDWDDSHRRRRRRGRGKY